MILLPPFPFVHGTFFPTYMMLHSPLQTNLIFFPSRLDELPRGKELYAPLLHNFGVLIKEGYREDKEQKRKG